MQRVAVVEDNPDCLALFVAILFGSYEVTAYDDGVVALEAMRRFPPDLVLMDISLPRLSGEEILQAMRADPELCRLPVIALTAYASSEDRRRLLEQGFDDYLSKPILDVKLLSDMVRHRLLGATP